MVAAQPKGSLPRAHTCTNESRDLESKQVESSKIASHFFKKKSNLIRFCFFLFQNPPNVFFAQVAIAKLRLSRGALDQAP